MMFKDIRDTLEKNVAQHGPGISVNVGHQAKPIFSALSLLLKVPKAGDLCSSSENKKLPKVAFV